MSINNPNFSIGQGDRRLDEAQKQEILARLPKAAHIGSTAAPLPIHAGSTYQVTKTLARQIAPIPGNTMLGGLTKPVAAHQITSLNPAVHKKEIQKVPLSLTSTAAITTIAGAGISNIIPVQISGTGSTTATSSTLHVPNVSSIVRGAVPGAIHHPTFSHLPRGVVAASAHVRAGSAINIQRQTLPTSIQATALNLQGQIRNVIPQMVRPGTPPTNRSGSPVICIGSAPDTHRASISLHNATTVGNTPSIQITLQASRTQTDGSGKPVTNLQSGKLHMNQALNMTSQPKVVVTHSLTPVLQHPTLAAKGNRGQPMGASSLSTVTVALSTTTVTIPIISSGTTSTTIPIAKVPPQRQQHIIQHQPLSHAVPTTISLSGHAEHRVEPSSFPQPQPAHAHISSATQGLTSHVHTSQTQPQAHSQAASSLFMYRSSPIVTTSNTSHTESRESSMPTMPFFPPYMLSPDNPYYQQLMRCQVAAVAQAQARPGMLPSQTTANLAASIQAASQGVTQTSGTNVRFNPPLMVMQDSLRPATPHTAGQTTTGSQIHHSATEGVAKVTTALPNNTMAVERQLHPAGISIPQPACMSVPHPAGISVPHPAGMSVSAVAAVASSLFTAATQNLHVPQIGQPAPNTASNTPVSNPNASPRPSILRKRTNEGVSAVKKQLAMTSEVHSPRPDSRPDSTPQSNMSSPKTPASGESQSSTDTALSSEATTPTQSHGEHRAKQEIHDPHENGYSNSTPEASPRKRRKQLLQATEEIKDTPVSVFDKLVEACVKEDLECNSYAIDDDDDLFDEDDDDLLSDDNRMEIRDEYVDEEGIRWTLEKCRPGVALLNYYNISWKPKNNHFNRYTDVKPKDERRPTVNELSNQKGVVQKASGWKLYHMAAQVEDLVNSSNNSSKGGTIDLKQKSIDRDEFELEKELNNQLTSLQTAIGPEPPLKTSLLEDESGMVHELTQGNIQRCKLISDQLNDAKAQMLKVLDHKPKILEIITKHMSKRPIKKKERT